jgi:hypothetical protein
MSDKIASEDLMLAFSMLDPVIGRSATDLIIEDLRRRGIILNDTTKCYSLDEISKALRITFSDDAVSSLIDYINARIQSLC